MWILKNLLENCKVIFKFLVLVGVLLKFLYVYFILYVLFFLYIVYKRKGLEKFEKKYIVFLRLYDFKSL